MSKVLKKIQKKMDARQFIHTDEWIAIIRKADEDTLLYIRDYVFKLSKYRRDDWISLDDQAQIKREIEDRFLDL